LANTECISHVRDADLGTHDSQSIHGDVLTESIESACSVIFEGATVLVPQDSVPTAWWVRAMTHSFRSERYAHRR